MMQSLKVRQEDVSLFETIDTTLALLKPLSFPLNLWNAQNVYFSIARNTLTRMKETAQKGDDSAKHWVEGFSKLGYYLHVKV